MIKPEELDKIAELARIDIEEGEKEKLRKDIEGIVEYISVLQTAPLEGTFVPDDFIPRNSMRPDSNPHETGAHSADLLAEAPRRKGDYWAVKKIL